jgi:hypothetical protein
MKSNFITSMIVFLIFTSNIYQPAYSQSDENQGYKKIAVYFTDKNNSPYSLTEPEKFLSVRAIERRQKAGIKINITDIPVNPNYIQSIQQLGGEYIAKSNWSNWAVFRFSNDFDLSKISSLSHVKKIVEIIRSKNAKPNKMIAGNELTEKKSYLKAFEKDNFSTTPTPDYGDSYNQIKMLGMDYLHSKGYMGEGIVIAVLDGGFLRVDELPAFHSIRENGQILGTWDFVENESSVYEDLSHGMMVLSTMAGFVNGKIVGTAPKAKYWLLRTEDGATETVAEEYYWEAGAVFADSAGADIINSSLGYTKFDDDIGSHTYSDMNGNTTVVTRAADWAASKGILVVNSAGNEGNKGWKYIGAPADGDSVLAIGAVNSERNIASFSSRGPSFDQRIKPDVCAQGEGTTLSSTDGQIIRGNGTSFSGPLIAGSAASLWSANPTATSMEIFNAIRQSADRYNKPDFDYGYGIPNFGYADLILKKSNSSSYYKNQKLKVYPSPNNSGIVYTDFFAQKAEELIIDIIDINGRTIASQKLNVLANSMNHISVNLGDNQASGVYTLRIVDGKNKFSEKFIIN